MLLKGKTINFIGDSITAGAGASAYDNCFVSLIGKDYGATVKNYGIVGTRIARQKTPSEIKSYDSDFLMRPYVMSYADITVIFGGTNDWGHGDALFGEDDDLTEWTFCGAFNMLVELIKKTLPDTRIVVLTPIRRIGQDSEFGEGNRQNGRCLSEYVSAVKRLSAKHGLPCLDLFEKLDFFDPNKQEVGFRYLFDGTHPSDLGHRILSDVIGDFLLKL